MRTKLSVVLVAVSLGLSSSASAENPEVNVNDFVPSVHSGDLVNVLTTTSGQDLVPVAGMWLTYRKDALKLDAPDGDQLSLMSDQLVADVYASVPFLGRASVGLGAPVFLMTSGDDPASLSPDMSAASGAAFGDLRLSGKVRLLGKAEGGFGLGVGQDFTFPTASGENYAGEQSVTGKTFFIADLRHKDWGVAGNLGYLARKNASRFDPEIADEIHLGLAGRVALVPGLLDGLLATNTKTYLTRPFASANETGAIALAGLRAYLGGFVVSGLGGLGLGTLPGTPLWEATVQIGWDPGAAPPDTDGDGLPDSDDECPTKPGSERTLGCPDRDRDGVADKADKCIDIPGLTSLAGCPDQDRDGVTDAKDRCPKHPGPMRTGGCPDTDEDGLVDHQDGCPRRKGPRALKGCPDSDGDGVADPADLCPEVMGSKATKGCPDADGDGVADEHDKCIDTPGLPALKGCPDQDEDGIADGDDR